MSLHITAITALSVDLISVAVRLRNVGRRTFRGNNSKQVHT